MTDLSTAEVTWDAKAIAQDSDDPDSLPEQIPLQGIRVTLTAEPRKVEVPEGAIEGWPARTIILRDWNLNTGGDGVLRNPEDTTNPTPVLIVASDAVPGKTIEWTSRISAPDTGVQDIVKTWLAPAGTVVDLTDVDSVPGTGGSNLAQYLQAVADARAAAQNAVDAAESAEGFAYQAQAAREGAETYAEAASDSAAAASTSATNAASSASDAQGYRDEASTARDETLPARDQAVTAAESAQQAESLVETAGFLLDERGDVSGDLDLSDLEKNAYVHLTLTGDVTVDLPESTIPGRIITLVMAQDSDGVHALTIPDALSAYGVLPLPAQGANAVSEWHLVFDGWDWKVRVSGSDDMTPTDWIA